MKFGIRDLLWLSTIVCLVLTLVPLTLRYKQQRDDTIKTLNRTTYYLDIEQSLRKEYRDQLKNER